MSGEWSVLKTFGARVCKHERKSVKIRNVLGVRMEMRNRDSMIVQHSTVQDDATEERLLEKEIWNSGTTKAKPTKRGVTDPSMNIKIKSGKVLLM